MQNKTKEELLDRVVKLQAKKLEGSITVNELKEYAQIHLELNKRGYRVAFDVQEV